MSFASRDVVCGVRDYERRRKVRESVVRENDDDVSCAFVFRAVVVVFEQERCNDVERDDDDGEENDILRSPRSRRRRRRRERVERGADKKGENERIRGRKRFGRFSQDGV